jgi:hypothetical protein
MKELIDRPQADLLLGVLLPAALLCLAAIKFRRARTQAAWLASAGVLLGILWRGFNAILDQTGPDSLLGIGVCAVVILGIGLAIGLLGKNERRDARTEI